MLQSKVNQDKGKQKSECLQRGTKAENKSQKPDASGDLKANKQKAKTEV